MKNIHVIPTDKPSRLQLQMNGNFHIENEQTISLKSYQNIYITSDEEIRVNDYITDGYKVWKWKDESSLLGRKKIILTTDQDLIKYGVQEIPKEFLEWFVKNPNYEFVMTLPDVKGLRDIFQPTGKNLYKIIIPKEEPKQETLINDADSHSWGFENFEVIKTEEDAKIFVEIMENIPEPNDKLKKAFEDFNKQETLEEAKKKFADVHKKEWDMAYEFGRDMYSFEKGAKWQAERMYSEEDMWESYRASNTIFEDETALRQEFEGWFKQFKKK